MQNILDSGLIANLTYLDNLYEIYLQDPHAVSLELQQYFQSLQSSTFQKDVRHAPIRQHFLDQAHAPKNVSWTAAQATLESQNVPIDYQIYANILQYIDSYRCYGHYHASLDPLNLQSFPDIKELQLSYYHLSEKDLEISLNLGDLTQNQAMSVKKIIAKLKAIYCQNLGIEYMHISNTEERLWFRKRLESSDNFSVNKEEKQKILEALIAAEGLEKYLGSKYVGQKRFSLEGADSLIPLMKMLIERAAGQGVKEVLIGMAHRGRLNVLVNILGKPPKDLFEIFEGKKKEEHLSGDVKYHLGFAVDTIVASGQKLHLALAFNPSHLEIIAPVVSGSARARQDRRKTQQKGLEVLAVHIHGDAAFAGQGVVMENFSLSQTRGYGTSGSIHIVVNNQVGFTISNPQDARSSWYCTDIAKMIEAPILHVNGNDPETVIFATQLAVNYRNAFKKDIVIDLVCYRRHGHQEVDEPSATQPVMYQIIKKMPTVYQLYAKKLLDQGFYQEEEVKRMEQAYKSLLEKGDSLLPLVSMDSKEKYAPDWHVFYQKYWDQPYVSEVKKEILKEIRKELSVLPESFPLQPQVAKAWEERNKMYKDELVLNWGAAETLAYAALLKEGYSVRLSGQDAGRGTFAHRHAVLYNQLTGENYIPLQNLSGIKGYFSIIDSLLSEEAVLAFEYGYASTNPNTLVIWEAQYGDFVNGAQVVIDQFISSSEQKWGLLCGLVMYLPHGYEGGGPEHTSARLERFLQLCAQENIQVCIPTTPAQHFHLLRRQMLRTYRKPLVIFTPKSLLRHKLAVSRLEELEKQEGFKCVLIEDSQKNLEPQSITKLILCSGKVYYDLLEGLKAQNKMDTVIIRIEQLYPFPMESLQMALKPYTQIKECIWCQEEPENQGAWWYIQPYLSKILTVRLVARLAAAAPAVGSTQVHMQQQAALVQEALS